MRVGALLRKELHALFGQPLLYVVGAFFLLLAGYYFYTDLVFFVTFGFGENIFENFFQLLFVDLRLVLLLTVPLLTMRAFAEEKKLGTTEMLFTWPLRDGEILAAKFLACALAASALLAVTVVPLLWLHRQQAYPPGPVAAAYLGLVLMAMSFVAIGLLLSSLTDNQVVAAMSTLGVLLLLWVLSWNESAGESGWLSWLPRLSMFDHFEGFARGVVETRDVVYFACLVAFGATACLQVLGARSWRGSRLAPTLVGLGGLLVALGFAGAFGERWNARFDLTPERRHTLSPHTRRILERLDADVEIVAFVRSADPANAWTTGLQDLGRARPLSVALVPDDLDAAGALDRGREFKALAGSLVDQGDVVRMVAPGAGPGEADVAVVLGGAGAWPMSRVAAFEAWLARGGRLLVLAEAGSAPELAAWLARRGADPQPEAVLDPDNRLHGGEGVSMRAFPPAQTSVDTAVPAPAGDSARAVASGLDQGVLLSLARPIAPGPDATTLLASGSGSWATRDLDRAQRGVASFDTTVDARGPFPVAVAQEWPVGNGSPAARMIVVGDADFATDGFLDFLDNRDFLLNSIGWLAGDDDLVALRGRRKEVGREQFFLSAAQAREAFALAVGVLPLLSALVALALVVRRRLAR